MQDNVLAEGSESQAGHLEVLLGKGDADDGDEQQHSEEDVHQPCPQTAKDNP